MSCYAFECNSHVEEDNIICQFHQDEEDDRIAEARYLIKTGKYKDYFHREQFTDSNI